MRFENFNNLNKAWIKIWELYNDFRRFLRNDYRFVVFSYALTEYNILYEQRFNSMKDH